MPEITVTRNVPDGISPSDVSRIVDDFIETRVQRLSEIDIERRAITTDAGLEAWMQHRYGKDAPTMPVVRASVYENGPQSERTTVHEISHHGGWASNDRRRPVYMRGALQVLIDKYRMSPNYSGSANGWCLKIAKRYLRRTKFTCFSRSACHDKTDALNLALGKKFRTSYALRDRLSYLCSDVGRPYGGNGGMAWIRGRQIGPLSNDQISYLSAMYEIIAKTTTLDERRAALIMYRASASIKPPVPPRR